MSNLCLCSNSSSSRYHVLGEVVALNSMGPSGWRDDMTRPSIGSSAVCSVNDVVDTVNSPVEKVPCERGADDGGAVNGAGL